MNLSALRNKKVTPPNLCHWSVWYRKLGFMGSSFNRFNRYRCNAFALLLMNWTVSGVLPRMLPSFGLGRTAWNDLSDGKYAWDMARGMQGVSVEQVHWQQLQEKQRDLVGVPEVTRDRDGTEPAGDYAWLWKWESELWAGDRQDSFNIRDLYQ